MELISEFRCDNNHDIEKFLFDENKAIRNDKTGKAKTHFVVDKNEPYTKDNKIRILGYFSLTTKPLIITEETNLSKNKVKDLDGINKNAKYIECYLIGQLGKNDFYKDEITGQELLNKALESLRQVQKIIGKRVVLVEAVDNPKVLKFYTDNNFEKIDEIITKQTNEKLHQMILKI